MKSEDMEVWHETQRYGMAQRSLGQKGIPKKPSGGLPQGLDDQRIQDEADRIASAFQNLTVPNSPRKTHYMIRVPEDVAAQARPVDFERLLDRVRRGIPGNLFFDTLPGTPGVYCFRSPDYHSSQEVRKCPLYPYPRI